MRRSTVFSLSLLLVFPATIQRMRSFYCQRIFIYEGCEERDDWPMGGKAKSRCCLGMLKVNTLRHSYLNVMKLESYSTTGECLNSNH